jgi:hypothetical protein
LIGLVQFGGLVEIRASTLWHWLASQTASASII